jgi:hypothetical protein
MINSINCLGPLSTRPTPVVYVGHEASLRAAGATHVITSDAELQGTMYVSGSIREASANGSQIASRPFTSASGIFVSAKFETPTVAPPNGCGRTKSIYDGRVQPMGFCGSKENPEAESRCLRRLFSDASPALAQPGSPELRSHPLSQAGSTQHGSALSGWPGIRYSGP